MYIYFGRTLRDLISFLVSLRLAALFLITHQRAKVRRFQFPGNGIRRETHARRYTRTRIYIYIYMLASSISQLLRFHGISIYLYKTRFVYRAIFFFFFWFHPEPSGIRWKWEIHGFCYWFNILCAIFFRNFNIFSTRFRTRCDYDEFWFLNGDLRF